MTRDSEKDHLKSYENSKWGGMSFLIKIDSMRDENDYWA